MSGAGSPAILERLGLPGKTLGIVGFGHTGKAMAALGKAFGMTVIVYTRSRPEDAENVDVLLSSEAGDSKGRLVEESDVVMLATQLTDVTYHMFSAREFARMKPTSFIINMARGPVLGDAVLPAQPGQHDSDLLLGRMLLPGRPPDLLHHLLGGGSLRHGFWLISTPWRLR